MKYKNILNLPKSNSFAYMALTQKEVNLLIHQMGVPVYVTLKLAGHTGHGASSDCFLELIDTLTLSLSMLRMPLQPKSAMSSGRSLFRAVLGTTGNSKPVTFIGCFIKLKPSELNISL